MKQLFLSSLILLLLTNSFAQKPYDAATIPEALKKNAYSVKREERLEFDIRAINKAVFKSHTVVTVLNENGKDQLEFHEFTDQFQSLESVNIQLFDAKGNALQKYKKSDLAKQTSGEGLVPDGKVYYIEFPVAAYPITMVVDYETRFIGLLMYPRYQLQVPEQSVENSTYIATVPADLDLRYKGINTTLAATTANDGKIKTYTWSVKNLPALEHEPGSVSFESRYPHILISPNKFELDGYAGDMTSWESFGKWYGALSVKADNLPEERKAFFRDMVKDAPDDMEKARRIYSYLQSNFRYVSIQLGIGGFKPFDADFVDKKKYGDCKALSNYMVACLKAVGINAYQALINATYNKAPVDPAFPTNGFNHVIVCVPMPKDSLWLECTSNTSDFGVLGNFTENRNALLIMENGGRLVPTPKSKSKEHVLASHTLIKLGEDGSGSATINLHTTGEYKQDFVNYINNQKKDDQKRFLVNYYGYQQPDDFDINYDQQNKSAPTVVTMSIGKVPEFSAGKKMFLNPRIYKIWASVLPKAENRTQDYYFEHPFVKTDTTIYALPEGFSIESLPKPREISCEYGNLTSSYSFDATKLQVVSIARLELKQYKIPAAKFLATKNFFNEVMGEYTEKIVVKKL